MKTFCVSAGSVEAASGILPAIAGVVSVLLHGCGLVIAVDVLGS